MHEDMVKIDGNDLTLIDGFIYIFFVNNHTQHTSFPSQYVFICVGTNHMGNVIMVSAYSLPVSHHIIYESYKPPLNSLQGNSYGASDVGSSSLMIVHFWNGENGKCSLYFEDGYILGF